MFCSKLSTRLSKDKKLEVKRKIVSSGDRLSENTKSEKFNIDTKGLTTWKFTKIPILGQPGEMCDPLVSQLKIINMVLIGYYER